MIRKLTILAAILLQLGVASTYAVTDKEMEEARVIAAKAYLRYANDGSGYLDEIRPKSMSELESKIKPKEKENLKAFKAVGLPKDYASWDKAKLVEYWSVTFFKSPGLTEKGKMARARVRKNISAMTVTAPQTAEQKRAEEERKAAELKKAEAEKKAADEGKIAAELSENAAETASVGAVSADAAAANMENSAEILSDSLGNLEKRASDSLEAADDIEKEKSHTWIYILVLAVLVGVVVWLVTFASNVMKRSQSGQDRMRSEEDRMAERQANEASKEMREKFAATLAQKNADISQLNAKVDQLNRENEGLKRDMEALVAETGSLRTRLTEAQRQLEDIRQAAAAVQSAPRPATEAAGPAVKRRTEPVTASDAVSSSPTQPRKTRIIYLGRVNSKGIFVRADRELNIGNSIYVLETTDGYAGTFRVASDSTVWEMALLTPQQSLMGGCVGDGLEMSEGNSRIVTDSPGTAVFEGGCWRVIRKARIHYE